MRWPSANARSSGASTCPNAADARMDSSAKSTRPRSRNTSCNSADGQREDGDGSLHRLPLRLGELRRGQLREIAPGRSTSASSAAQLAEQLLATNFERMSGRLACAVRLFGSAANRRSCSNRQDPPDSRRGIAPVHKGKRPRRRRRHRRRLAVARVRPKSGAAVNSPISSRRFAPVCRSH